ncbi:beta-lactamase superfamily domain-containing protein [Dioszegia hungarica]|uniref:Beta-lactamase superfamily domain-containing protein n=1 Tax=Dioszegia hungarica TaxID=4972 RepID=A0AA38LUJ2_9TREE|nr:beta-lactamase superfamily domain-containing protein [Dioszegia hungarica]KAI9635790.1 beta-lactamase superfamily domain-containing protein [Dioszegia hungarica]
MAQSACSKPSPAQTLSIILDLLTSKLIGFCTARDLSTTPGIGPVDPVFDDPHRPSPFEVAAPCTSIRTIWIGHASTYTLFPTSDPLRSFGVLTDPIFSKSCSPVGWPRRRVAVPFGVEGLGPVDAVIISHNHYDHLDKPSIRAIEALGRDTKFFVPLGTGRWFVKLGIPLRRIFELDWWEIASKPQELRMDDLPALKAVFKITCTPAQHPTGRSFLFFDKNATKSATWVVEQSPCRGVSGGFPQREGARMFFGGDTGFRSSDVSPVAEFVQGEWHRPLLPEMLIA